MTLLVYDSGVYAKDFGIGIWARIHTRLSGRLRQIRNSDVTFEDSATK